MRLAKVLKGVEVLSPVPETAEVRGLSVDSRDVRPGDLFVALRGGKNDGHAFLPMAKERGAVAALVEIETAGGSLPAVRVPSTRAALPRAAANFFGDPSASLAVVGVTGTNGKTTVTYLLESILGKAGCRTGVLGTINYRIGGEVLRTGLTTPFPHELQAFLVEAKGRGATHVVMEVSSHSAAQGRIDGVRFDAGVFTNLSHDHLDFHGTMEAYFDAKARFFREVLPEGGKKAGMAINADDPYGERLCREFPGAISFGFGADRSIRPHDLSMTLEGTRMTLETPRGPLPLASRLIGAYNVSNILAAVGAAVLLGVPDAAVAAGIEALAAIPGRMERIGNSRGIHAYVDYAHTPQGLDRVLSTLRALATGRLITVFGCGGDRDRTKRPEMGRIAAMRSDVVIVTSDNPRTEDPAAILSEIVPGVAREGFLPGGDATNWDDGYYLVMPDRRSAIARALSLARPGDTVAIAGKGHENVQIVGDRRLPFDDRQTVRELLDVHG